MKKTLAVLVLLNALINAAFSQESILFNIQYKPEQQYNQTVEQTSVIETKYVADEAFLEKLKAQNMQNPTIKKTESVIETTLTTGKLTDNTHFPIKMTFIKMTSADGRKAIPDGTTMYGQCTLTGVPVFDSISSEGMRQEFKTTFMQSMKSMLSQVSFPNKRFKIGEEHAIKSPMSIPIADQEIKMDITTNYKFISVANGLARFDITQAYTMSMANNMNMTMKASGDGKGFLQYDIAKNYYTQYNVTTNIDMDIKTEKLGIDMKMISDSRQTVELKDN